MVVAWQYVIALGQVYQVHYHYGVYQQDGCVYQMHSSDSVTALLRQRIWSVVCRLKLISMYIRLNKVID